MSIAEEQPELLRRIFDRYLQRRQDGPLEPALEPLGYDFSRFGGRAWFIAGDTLLQDELRELTNILNRWQQLLERWQAWNEVLAGLDEAQAWALRREFQESDVHWCLIFPSAVRDAIAFVSTNAVHQIRLATEHNYVDHLEGDPTTPGRKQRRLRRPEREAQLRKLLWPWQQGAQLLERLQAIDDEDYRRATLDYRNEHSHAIGPELEFGHTQFMHRSVESATKMERGTDGYYRDVLIPGKMAVKYIFGGRPPLDLQTTRHLNLAQYLHARACFETYTGLLDIIMAGLPQNAER